jgi:GNAT superfamily N-acetyltransferase
MVSRRRTYVMSVFKIKCCRRRMSLDVVPWKGPDGMRYWFWNTEGLRPQVQALLEKMWKYLDIPDESFEEWYPLLRKDMGDENFITLFAVSVDENRRPTEVLGFVHANISEEHGVYIKYLCVTYERQGVGTLLLDRVVQVVPTTSRHTLAFLSYKPGPELLDFYTSRGFLPLDELLLADETVEILREYQMEPHIALGVKMLTGLNKKPKQPDARDQAEAGRKEQRAAAAVGV